MATFSPTEMSSTWQHYNPVRITTGIGCRKCLASTIQKYRRVLLVTTAGMERRGTAQAVKDMATGTDWHVLSMPAEPTITTLDTTVAELCQGNGRFDAVVALGGGSVLDSGKALALSLPTCLPQPLHVWLREAQSHAELNPLPLFCLPTTAGTGAEVTPFATIWDKKEGKKYSLAGENVYPQQAFLDPELTRTLPPQESFYSALDAVSHALETLWNRNATPLSLDYATRALELMTDALDDDMDADISLERRAQRQYAALLAGLAISQSRTSVAHAMSYPLTLHFGVPHGLACAVFLHNILMLLENNAVFRRRITPTLFHKVDAMLIRHQLGQKIAAFCGASDIEALQDELLQSERSSTFLLDNAVAYLEAMRQLS